VYFMLPDDVADGEATVRVGDARSGALLSAPLKFTVTSGPLPLNLSALSSMYRVAPGQWTDLAVDADIEFEIGRADRIEVEFSQGDVAVVVQPTGPRSTHIHVPSRLSPGAVRVRTRTWIEQTVSDWSADVRFQLLDRPAAPHVELIHAGPSRRLTWSAGGRVSEFATAKPGDVLWLRGHFPVARAADLTVQLRGVARVLDLAAADFEDGVQVEIPTQIVPGDWQLVIGSRDGARPRIVTTVRIR
jgi:hypothetical protein